MVGIGGQYGGPRTINTSSIGKVTTVLAAWQRNVGEEQINAGRCLLTGAWLAVRRSLPVRIPKLFECRARDVGRLGHLEVPLLMAMFLLLGNSRQRSTGEDHGCEREKVQSPHVANSLSLLVIS